MFGKKKSSLPKQRIDSLIGASTVIQGDVRFQGGLRIDGHVQGHVHAASDSSCTLVIGETGRIEGEIRASHVVIHGQVDGPVFASEYLELLNTARIRGDVTYNTLEMHVGAIVEGRLLHVEPERAEVVEIKRQAAS
ncbi:MAG: polymer-forming cytoskeletal protein [Casimicrobiaceae bacterium]|nr:polymer-forming cytoskeletal protein [Casimicrobiaceae bacterium]MCX8097880.1 polymer-forming cytoskeletal protein [Casimicrobiaceae bacterium]MDW8311329.1 polymer-forming cytoskeletal protein [Burkholderiales bacterium]